MDLIAKRKLDITWREAVAARAVVSSSGRESCLAQFDDLVAGGASEAEAAYRTLKAIGLLWPIDAEDSLSETGPEPAGPHDVPVM